MNNELRKLDGGKKIISTSKGDILRLVWVEVNTGKYLIQYNNDMPEVIRSIKNNAEIFILVK